MCKNDWSILFLCAVVKKTLSCHFLQGWRQPMVMHFQISGLYLGAWLLKGTRTMVERGVSECYSGRMTVCRSSWEAARNWTLHFAVNWTSLDLSWSTTHRTRPKTSSRSSRTRQQDKLSTRVKPESFNVIGSTYWIGYTHIYFLILSLRSVSRTPAGDPSIASASWRDD